MARKAIAIALLLVPLATLETGAASTPAKPNFVIILAHDLGYGDVSCYGGAIQTPNIDQLAKEGTRFTDFHSNGANCSPTRCALLTGRYQHRAGIGSLVGRDNGLKPDELTLAEALKSSGYATALFGKWHLGELPEFNPVRQGFDEFRGLLGGRTDYFTHALNGKLDWWEGLKRLDEKGYSTTLIADQAVDFIRRSQSKPFCLYVAFNAVHTPIQDPETGEGSKTAETYGKVTQSMDKAIGRIVAALKDNGSGASTLVFFFSDNGAPEIAGSSNKPFSGHKGTVWEGGHRIPAIAWWPGRIAAGRSTDQTVMGMDLMPTFLELGGAKMPPGHELDGVSLVSLLCDNRPLPPRKLFWNKGPNWAMRDGVWKLLIEGRTVRLFNLSNDLSEKHDVAAQQPRRVKSMQAAIEFWAKEVGAGNQPNRPKNKERRSPGT